MCEDVNIPIRGIWYNERFRFVQWMGALFFALFFLLPIPGALAESRAPVFQARILAEHPHDVSAFTQGLLVLPGGDLVESTGLYGRSEIRRVRLKDGHVSRREKLPPAWFGEGVALTPRGVFQLTWREGRALLRDPESLLPGGEFRYTGEGWGLAFDGRWLIMSDGSARLAFRDPGTFIRMGDVVVVDGGEPVENLNELEWVGLEQGGVILANVWQTPHVVAIDPESGQVLFRIDLTECWKRSGRRGDRFVPNGIAWDEKRRWLLVTGKGWPKMFRIEWPPQGAVFDREGLLR